MATYKLNWNVHLRHTISGRVFPPVDTGKIVYSNVEPGNVEFGYFLKPSATRECIILNPIKGGYTIMFDDSNRNLNT